MSDKMAAFKNEICDRHLIPIEDRIRQIWPNSQPKVTMLIRTPWLPDGGILITNDSIDAAIAEINRLSAKESVQ